MSRGAAAAAPRRALTPAAAGLRGEGPLPRAEPGMIGSEPIADSVAAIFPGRKPMAGAVL